MEPKRFQRKHEDFICLHCGFTVAGDGYTDHCPICLWSRHVDINPGDRAETCQGLMEPVSVELKHGEYIINYICQKCGYAHKCRAREEDNLDEIIKLSTSSLF